MYLVVISTSQDKVMNIYMNSFGISLSLSLIVSIPSTCFSLSFFSLTYQEFITVTEEVQAWETEGLHGRQWARHFMTKYQPHRTWHPLKQHNPTRDFSFTKALVLGIQGSACQQRHPKYQWKLSCCGIQHSKHQKQGNYCWHEPPLCHKRPLSIRAVSVTEKNKRNAWINQPWVELIRISKSSLTGRIDLKNYTDLCWKTQLVQLLWISEKRNLSVFISSPSCCSKRVQLYFFLWNTKGDFLQNMQ